MMELLEKIIKDARADGVHLVLIEEDRFLTRFAGNVIHQNLGRKKTTLIIRVIRDGKTGIFSTDNIDGTWKNYLRRAEEIADRMPKDPDLPLLPERKPHKPLKGYFDSTADFTPMERANAIKKAVKTLEKSKISCTGAFDTKIITTYVATSTGIRKSFKETLASFHIIAESSGSTGWAGAVDRDVSKINTVEISEKAAQKAIAGKEKRELPPGRYTVILEEEPVAHLLLFLAFMGFGGKTFVERRSFMYGRIGERITGENVTIVDDATDPRTAGMPFDYEGVPKRRVVLIERGIARDVVTDTYYAKKLGKESTGHALRPDNKYGPYPKNMIFEGGELDGEEFMKSVERGILVTKLWYVNFMNPMKTMVTGTTRDGTLLIEDGRIKGGVKDMRFVISILESFSKIQAISKELKLRSRYGAHLLVPKIVVEDFLFTGE
jgi:predicted Zn-dependent protease